jgi:hypothetical protein
VPSAGRIALTGGPFILLAIALAGPAWQLASLAGAGDWGSDWRWLEDGLRRLASGEPLVRPEYVSAPFSQFPNGPAYTWSLHPPSTATLVAPWLLLPDSLRQPIWAWVMAGSLGVAVWLAWPHRLWWGSQLVLVAVLVGPPTVGVSAGLVDQLHFANPNAVVVLGVVITWIGRRHGSVLLMAGGLVLAAVKIVPALGLAAWLLADQASRQGRGATGGAATGGAAMGDAATSPNLGVGRARPVGDVDDGRPGHVAVPAILTAGAVIVALTLPVLVLDPGALADTLASQGHLIPWTGEANLAPAVRLGPLLGDPVATWLSRAVAVGILGLVAVRGFSGPGGFLLATSAPLLLTPQLWAHWLLIPAIALLASASEWPPVRVLDRRLRLAWLDSRVGAAASAGAGQDGRRA